MQVFQLFLNLGGVDTSPKQFTGGLTQDDFEDLTADEIVAITSTDIVSDERCGNLKRMDYLVRGFLYVSSVSLRLINR